MRSRRVFLGLALVTVCTGSVAQVPAPAPAPPPRYEVEILVFAHRDFDATEERFPLEVAELPEAALEAPLAPPVFDVTALSERAPEPPPLPLAVAPEVIVEDPLSVRPLLPEELKLGTEYRRLQAIAAYVPLLHGGWIQPGLAEADAKPFELQALGVRNPSGTVRVHLSRFLHVTLDLTYVAPLTATAAVDAGTELTEIAIAPRYRLAATRNVRSNELHYFDHPAFGVLVRVTPRTTQSGTTGRRPAA